MSETKVTGLPLGIAGDSLYNALPLMQKRVTDQHGARDLSVDVVIGDVCDQTVFTSEGEERMALSICLHHPEGVGDIAQATFRACSYALFTVVREEMRHISVREGKRRIVPVGTELAADMPVGEAHMTLRVTIL